MVLLLVRLVEGLIATEEHHRYSDVSSVVSSVLGSRWIDVASPRYLISIEPTREG